jgi:hypothetical protein
VYDKNLHAQAPLVRSPPGRIIGPLTDDLDFDATLGRESALTEYRNRTGNVLDEKAEAMAEFIQYPVRSFGTADRRGYI